MSETQSCSCQSPMPDILTAKLISQHLGICYSNALALIKSGSIPSVIRIGQGYRVPRAAYERWLNSPELKDVL